MKTSAPAADAPRIGLVCDAAVDLELDGQPGFVDHPSQAGDLGLHGTDVGLAAESRIDGHGEDQVGFGQDMLDNLGGSVRVERDAAARAEVADAGEGAMQVGAGFGVHDDQVASRVDVPSQQLVGVDDHEMRFEPDRAVRPRCRNDVRAEGEVGDEDTVHDVPLDPVHARLAQLPHLVAEAGEVGRQHRRHDERRGDTWLGHGRGPF
jgi:hypothetical protein